MSDDLQKIADDWIDMRSRHYQRGYTAGDADGFRRGVEMAIKKAEDAAALMRSEADVPSYVGDQYEQTAHMLRTLLDKK